MRNLFFALALVTVAGGCKSSSTDVENEPAEENVVEETEASPEDAKDTEEAEPAKVEVKKTEFDATRFGSHAKGGELQGGFAFEDSAGENAVLFVVSESGDEDSKTASLVVKHVVADGSTVSVVREFKEVVEDCDADIVLEPKWGSWSVTDVDDDGLGEATFAYTADCTSDISPLSHKVLISSDGEKFGLRGNTRIKPGPDADPIGGEYKADKMPEGLLDHAKSVWDKTSKSYGMEK